MASPPWPMTTTAQPPRARTGQDPLCCRRKIASEWLPNEVSSPLLQSGPVPCGRRWGPPAFRGTRAAAAGPP
eukprot:392199-Pyramimonas_sp.AAC.1